LAGKINKSAKPPSCWIVSDGTVGMETQSRALSAAAGLKPKIITLYPNLLARLFPRMARFPFWPLWQGDSPLPGGAFPDLIICCGRRMAGAGLGVRRLSSGKSRLIQIGDPRLPPDWFDLLVVPAHDPAARQAEEARNIIISTGALNRLDAAAIEAAAEAAQTAYGEQWADLQKPGGAGKGAGTNTGTDTGQRRLIAVLLGGANRRYVPEAADFARLGRQLAELAKNASAGLVIIPSRRTGADALVGLSGSLEGVPHWFWDGQGENPYPGVLGLVAAVVVTSDSVNMASEAALTGLPLLVGELRPETGRIADFHARMQAAGHSAPLGPQLPDAADFTRLDEMPRIAAELADRLGL
jgi:mitochondrial fission protein ELM1